MDNKEHQFDYSDDSINELVLRCKSGDDFSYTKLLQIFEPLVVSIVKKYLAYGNYDDLMQCGWLGLTMAVNSFDINKNTKFSTFAYWKIKESILKWVNQNSSISMSQGFRQLVLKIRRIINDYVQTNNGKEPEDEEIQVILNDDKVKLETISIARFAPLNAYSLDEANNDSEDNKNFLDKKIITDIILDKSVKDDKLETFIKYVFISGLDERELFIVTSKHGINDNNKIYKTTELAKLMNLSDSRIMQLYRRGIKRIKKKMASNGIKVKKRN